MSKKLKQGKKKMTASEMANRIFLRKLPNGEVSNFDIYAEHFLNDQGQGQTDLKIRFSHHAPASTITLETVPNFDTSAAISRWAGLINDLRVIAKPTGRNITLQDHHLLDKDVKVADTTSRDTFMQLMRDYMLQHAGRPVTGRRKVRTMDSRARIFTGLVHI